MAPTLFGAMLLLSAGLACCAVAEDDSDKAICPTDFVLPAGQSAWSVQGSSLFDVADRIVNGRANVMLIGDSIQFTDMSAAYIATFRPRHGLRGYATMGYTFDLGEPWSGYTNILSAFDWYASSVYQGDILTMRNLLFHMSDEATEDDPGSPWTAYEMPCNARRVTALSDLPGESKMIFAGSGKWYDRVWADSSFLTRTGVELQYRLLYYDHPNAMPFTVRAQSTMPENAGGVGPSIEVPIEHTDVLTSRVFEYPELVELSGAERELNRWTGLSVETMADHEETHGESLLIGGVVVTDVSKDLGIQWGLVAASGAQAREFNLVPIESWRTTIAWQRSDVYLIQLGTNDLFNSVTTGAGTALRINTLIERLAEAHSLAQQDDPTIQDPLFLLVTMWDMRNPNGDPAADNREWVALAEGQTAIARVRPDTACIDLRTMIEDRNGAYYSWRGLRLRDGVHPKGPYWRPGNYSEYQEDPFPDGSIYFAGLVWDVLLDTAPNSNDAVEDITNDGCVDGADLLELLHAWGPAGPDDRADINRDGVVDSMDMVLLLGAWSGPACG